MGFVGRVVLTEPQAWVPAPFSLEVEEQALATQTWVLLDIGERCQAVRCMALDA